ncbi:MAG: hypothetical protein OQK35_05890 [Alphaproteobacteria bacterium]|nr:hypothetical protein [Alphaproteobacteria bacterium]
MKNRITRTLISIIFLIITFLIVETGFAHDCDNIQSCKMQILKGKNTGQTLTALEKIENLEFIVDKQLDQYSNYYEAITAFIIAITLGTALFTMVISLYAIRQRERIEKEVDLALKGLESKNKALIKEEHIKTEEKYGNLIADIITEKSTRIAEELHKSYGYLFLLNRLIQQEVKLNENQKTFFANQVTKLLNPKTNEIEVALNNLIQYIVQKNSKFDFTKDTALYLKGLVSYLIEINTFKTAASSISAKNLVEHLDARLVV